MLSGFILKEKKDFDRLFKKRKQLSSKYVYIYKDENTVDNYRFGICVSKKIGNAVTRNKIKRQIKDIIDKSSLHFFNNDYIILVKQSIKDAKFVEIKDDIINLLKKINE